MKVTYNWLKEFVEIRIPARDLADRLTMAGLEVVSLEERAGDFVFEIEITSNRPDWLSVLGIAREAAALTGARLKTQKTKIRSGSKKSGLKIEIEDKKDCPLYTCRVIRDVKVGPSPQWLRQRLELIGCRSVNNVVDITNYVLFELGEPLHAFDLDKLDAESIIVRRARTGEKLATIDGQERALTSSALVIADKHKPLAAAGVMGGKDSEVGSSTRNILLEAAVFDPVLIRRSRQALGLTSESSYRFERGVDPGMVERASLRAARLISEYALAGESTFNSSGQLKAKERSVTFDTTLAAKVLGVTIAAPKIKQMLLSLGFRLRQAQKKSLSISVPSFRQDVRSEIDLIEEVARIFGYARIPASLPAVKPHAGTLEKRDLVQAVKGMLVGLGLNEAITYSLTDRGILNSLGIDPGLRPIEIMNPLNREQGVLRTSLIPGLGGAISFNLNQKQEYVALFEIAKIFLAKAAPEEELHLGVALSGAKSLLLEHGLVREEAGLLNLKGILETLFLRLGVSNYGFDNRNGRVDICIGEETVGQMLSLSQQALDALNIKNRHVFMFEVSLEKILSFARPDKKLTPIPRYPGITRDISFVLKEDISVKEILSLLKEKGRPLLRDIRIADYYRGKQIPEGYRGLTLSCLYGSDERTLTEGQVQPVHELLSTTLTQEFGVKIR